MRKQSFLHGALILMLAGLINRIVGFVLRVILVRMIDVEGLGLFQMVYPLFLTLLLICTAGFPIAITKLIPERLAVRDQRGVFALFKTTLCFTSLLSIMIALALFFSAEKIADLIYRDQRVYYILLASIPALLISPLAASFRGFFQGMHNMIPTAASQITEQLSRGLATIMLVGMFAELGLKYQAAGIALGLSVGELVGFLVLVIILISSYFSPAAFFKKLLPHKKEPSPAKYRHGFFFYLKSISQLAVPITLGRILNALMLSGEAVLIPRQLQVAGFSLKEATSLYGQLSGMVEQLIFFPTVITIALTTSLIPNISDAHARNDLTRIKNHYQDVVRVTTYLGMPVTVIFWTRGEEICQLLFGYPTAGSILAVMAFSAFFIYYLQVSHGMLNGLGKPQLALLNLSVGSLLKLIGIFYLTRLPELGIKGAAVSIGLGYVLASILNFIVIGHNIGYGLNLLQCFIKPLLASFCLFLFNQRLELLFELLPFQLDFRLETVLILLSLILVYLLIMLLSGTITDQDIRRFKQR